MNKSRFEAEVEAKIEGSIAVQARIDLRCLASLDYYWTTNSFNIKSMSQLVGWSIELCLEMLLSQGGAKKKFETLAEAYSWIEGRGLHQKSMKKRGIKKLVTAMGFEELRANGEDPEDYARSKFRQIHESNKGRQEFVPFQEGMMKMTEADYKPIISDEEWDRAQERIKEEEEKEAREHRKEFRQRLSEAGAETGKEFVNGEAEVIFKQPERIVDFSKGEVEDKEDKDIKPITNSNDSCQIRKMTDEEVLEKEKDIKLREEKQREVNDLMMSAPKSGLVED